MNIKPGDLLGILAPASSCDPQVLKAGVSYIESCGYRVRVALDPAAAWETPIHLFSSDTPEARVNALYHLFEDDQVSAILSVRGGYGTMELLPLIDLERLSRCSKPLVGISDVSALLNVLAQRTAIPVIHGAAFPNGFSKADSSATARASCEDLFALLSGRCESLWQDNISYLAGSGDFQGTIVGGNISMLAAVAGTSWAPEYDSQVLFIEEIGEKPYRIHRLLMQLKLAGSLKNLRGVVVGDFINCAPPEGKSANIEQVMRDIFSEYGYPVVTGGPFGHGECNLAFQVGGLVSVSQGSIKISVT